MKQEFSCIILDDEPLAVQLLEDYAHRIGCLRIEYAGDNVTKAMEIIQSGTIDLTFIDIQMPEMNGIEFMEIFNKGNTFIITSAYQQYALGAFKFHVIDYLIKPIIFQTFCRSVTKYISWRNSLAQHTTPITHLFVKADRKHHKIALDDILYFEGMKDYIKIHLKEEVILMLENMKDVLNRLPRNLFIRIHRSYIVPIDKIRIIEGNRIQMFNGEVLPIGETYRKTIADWLNKQ